MTAQPAAAAAAHVEGDVRCVGCGYALLGLPVGGVCPECSCAVSDSLSERPFGFLSDGDARQLRRGIRCILASLRIAGLAVGLAILAGVIMSMACGVLAALAGIGAGACWVIGWFFVIQARPAAADARARIAGRMAVAASWLQVAGFIGVLLATLAGASLFLIGLAPVLMVLMLIAGNAWLEKMVQRSGVQPLVQSCGVARGFALSAAIGMIAAVVALMMGSVLGVVFLLVSVIPISGALLTWWSFLHGIVEPLDHRLKDSTRA